jgi:restriction system protein
MERFFVQCKHWSARLVDVKVVRELKGVIAGENATGGAVVTTGQFTRDAG